MASGFILLKEPEADGNLRAVEEMAGEGAAAAVIDLCQGALEIPIELEAVVFVVLEALEFDDEVEFEFG